MIWVSGNGNQLCFWKPSVCMKHWTLQIGSCCLEAGMWWGTSWSYSFASRKVRENNTQLKVCSAVAVWNICPDTVLCGDAYVSPILEKKKWSPRKETCTVVQRKEWILSDSGACVLPFHLVLCFLQPTCCGGFRNLHLKQCTFDNCITVLSGSSLEAGYLGVKGHSPPVNNVEKETHSNPLALPLPSPLPCRTASARYSCNVCLLQRVTQLQSTEQPRHAVFTYSWLWPRRDFFFFHQLTALQLSL